MNLSKRLRALADLVPFNSNVGDIGADHGLLDLFLLEKGQIQKAFMVENKQGPYKRLLEATSSSPYKDKIETSLSDGISQLPSYVNCVIIAGMGGNLIKKIIVNNVSKMKNVTSLVIDAHDHIEEVLSTLGQLNFALSDDIFLEEEGIFYDVLLFKKVDHQVVYRENELRYGPLQIKKRSPSWLSYLSKEKDRYQNLLNDSSLPLNKKNEYGLRLEEIEELLHEN
jgi:tRNA (adenine22-N1)-methyltransferase